MKQRIDRFLFAPASPLGLIVARTVLALQALWIVLSRPGLAELSGWPRAFFHARPGELARFTLVPGAAADPVLYVVLIAALVAVVFNILPRTLGLLAALLLYHFAPMEAVVSSLPYTACLGGLTLPMFALFILAFAERPRRGAEWSSEYRWPLVLIQLVFVFHFVNAGLAKLHWTGIGWYSPSNFRGIAVTLWTLNFQRLGMTVFRTPWLAGFLGAATFVLELGFPLVLVSRRARWIFLPAAFIAAFLRIYVFGFFFLSFPAIAIVANWDAVARWLERRRAVTPTPETELLIAATAGAIDAVQRIAPQVSDWRYVLEHAQLHGVLQLVTGTLRTAGVTIPEPAGTIAQRQSDRNAARALLHHRETRRVVTALRERGITATPYKGTTLSLLLYGKRDVRTSGDIDLLVASHDVLRAIDVIRELGYERAFTSANDELLLANGKEMALNHEQLHCTIDLQWRAFPRNESCGFDSATETLTIVPLAEEAGLTTVVADELFLLLAHHGLKHEWELLKWIRDTDAFCRRSGVDWQRVADRARATGLTRSAGLAVAVSHAIFGTPVPAALEPLTHDPTTSVLTARIVRALRGGVTKKGALRTVAFQLQARERWIDRLRFIRYICTPKPWDATGPATHPLLRPLHLLMKSRRQPHAPHDVQKLAH